MTIHEPDYPAESCLRGEELLPDVARRPAVCRIGDVRSQDRVHLTGTIREAGTISIGNAPAWRCVLADDTGELDLLFLGRTAVAGLAEGTRCVVEGTATPRQGRLTVWNPRYQADPDEPVPRAVKPADLGAADDEDHGTDDDTCVVEPAGHFRIYLGVAAGAGKTMAMLGEGHRRRQRGADVVIALVECHGRPVTQTRAAGLETVQRKTVTHHDGRFEEMDTAAVLARHPGVALVDELAHTNVPGSGPHDKRWQDVLDLLDAGIDVITTVNIQHLESIADTVEQITGIGVRERVPDWVVRRADQIELVDSSPEQLRRRMLHGNIYPRDTVPEALTHFFRTDNLAALREMALRFMADETDEHLLERLARHRPTAGHGRPPSALWPASLPSPAPRPSSGARRGSPPGSRPGSTWCTSSAPTTAGATVPPLRWPTCSGWPAMSAPPGIRSRATSRSAA